MGIEIKSFMKNKYIRNFIYLFTGSSLASFIGIFNTAILIKAIGLGNNGVIFLGLSYSNFFNTLFNFQSYEAVIKFLPQYMSTNNKEVKNIIKQALFLDVVTAVFAFIVAKFLVIIIANYLKWDILTIKSVKVLTYSILFTITGCFMGILRIYEEFKYMSMISLIVSILNTFLYIFGIIFKLNFEYYVYITLLSVVLNFIVTLYFTYLTLKKNRLLELKILSVKFDKTFIKFVLYTNLSSTLDLPIFQLTPFIINKYLGVSEVAIYKILEKIGELIKRVTSIMGQSIMPDISKRLSKNDFIGAKNITIKLGKIIFLIGVMGIILIALTKEMWLVYFIPDYNKYIYSLYLYLILIIFTQMFIAQHPLFIYSGYIKESVKILLCVNSIYIYIIFFFTKEYGINGVIFSRIIQAAMIFLIKGLLMRKGRVKCDYIK